MQFTSSLDRPKFLSVVSFFRADLWWHFIERNQSAVKVATSERFEHKMPMLRTSSGARLHKRSCDRDAIPSRIPIRGDSSSKKVGSESGPSDDALPPQAPRRGNDTRAGPPRDSCGPRSAPVTPPSSILFDYSVMGEKKASERARPGREGGGGTRQKGGTRWVVINGEAIWFLLGDVLFALRGGLRRHNEQASVLMNLHSFADHNRPVRISWQSEALISTMLDEVL